MEKVIAFDLEIVKEIPEGTKDWKELRPLGISCAATMCTGDPRPTLWFHGKYGSKPLSGRMELDECQELVYYILEQRKQGFIPLTWNGLQFDFDVLAEESDMHEWCKHLALNHIDMMFHFFCVKGFPVGLNAVAKGMGLSGKTKGMHGDLAPTMWAGTDEDRQKVLEYVGQDVITTMEIYETALVHLRVPWVTLKGEPRFMPLPLSGWKTVKECLELPVPDNSWMKNPMTREGFMEWIK